MTSFNEINGIPASGDKWLLEDVLRKEWGFDGMIVSDWQSILEMVYHGSAENREAAGIKSIEAGVDMDMMAEIYLKELYELINKNGKYLDTQQDLVGIY